MKIAYVRVSTVEQNEARQIEALEKFGVENGLPKNFSKGHEPPTAQSNA